MRAIYNGIDLGVFETYAFNWESVYDDSNTDYLYTKVTLIVRAIVNGQAEVIIPQRDEPFNGPPISYDFTANADDEFEEGILRTAPATATVGDFRAAPKSVKGFNVGKDTGIAAREKSKLRVVVRRPSTPTVSLRTIRHRLSTPRATLWVFSGPGQEAGELVPGSNDSIPSGPVMLRVPFAGGKCDCKNGPFPKLLGVHAAYGDANTLAVDWAVETYVNESSLNAVTPQGALLSNRFAQTHSVGYNGYTTVAVAGTAIFRTDLVYSLPETPDLKRPVIFMPIPQGFIRGDLEVTGRKDVTGVDYSYQDRQVPVNFVAAPYARAAAVTAVHRQAITRDASLLGGALGVYERLLSIKAQQEFARGDKTKPSPTLLPGALKTLGRAKRPTP